MKQTEYNEEFEDEEPDDTDEQSDKNTKDDSDNDLGDFTYTGWNISEDFYNSQSIEDDLKDFFNVDWY